MKCKYPGCNNEIYTYPKKKTLDLFCKKHCRIQNLTTYNIRFGKEEGKKKYDKMIKNRKKSKSLEGMIEKFGEIEGNKKWVEYCNKQRERNTLKGKIKKWGKEEGLKKYEEWKEKCGIVVRRGFFLEEAQINYDLADWLLKKRQSVFSKEICIEKYGEEEGLKRWKKRQEKWQNTLNSKSINEKNKILELKDVNGSVTEKEFLFELEEKLKIKIKRNKAINGKYVVDGLYNNTIIEFFGDFWHCNPEIYSSSYYHPILKKRSNKIWSYDNERIGYLKRKGYSVIIIWESDWNNKKEEIIKECFVKLVK